MAFAADDLAAWLVGVLADAARKKLTTLVLGDELDRGLTQAATAAVLATSRELCPGDEEQARTVSMVVSQVFAATRPGASLSGLGSVLETLQAGIGGQLAVLDDRDMTGTGESSADALGIPAAVLAQELTRHLVNEIVNRGVRGGPLFPLAVQINNDLTHLQGQRLEHMIDQLGADLLEALTAWREQNDAAALERLDHVSASTATPARLAGVGPATLLRADRRVVGFIERPELTTLREWCDAEDGHPVLLLTGAGGVGKTRLALHLAQERGELGWMCRIVRPGEEADAVQGVRAVSSGRLLLIIDYAETRLGLTSILRAAGNDAGDRLRVLFLARSAGEWWAQLGASTEASARSVVASAVHVPVHVSLSEGSTAGDIVRSAIQAFASVLGIPAPDPVEVTTGPGAVPILVFHAAALLAVLDAGEPHRAGPLRVVATEEVLDELLVRERAFWLGSARAVQLTGLDTLDSVVAAQAVAVACLIAVTNEAEAAQTLRRVPDLADSPLGACRKIARWLRQIYPAGEAGSAAPMPRWWGSLQPDLLAERHVVGQLAASPDLADACLRGLGKEQAGGALTVLGRACARHSEAPGLLETALRADLPGLGVAAVEVAIQTGGLLGRVLARVMDDAPATLDELIMIQQAIPYPTVILAAADAAVAQRITRSLPDGTASSERAEWNDLLSTRLAQAGEPREALLPAQEAVAVYSELARVDPDRYRPKFAAALANLGVRFYRLGQLADGIAAAQHAVSIRRELAQANPARYLPDLATSLSNLGAAISEAGTPLDALAPAQEAVRIHRQLAQGTPGSYLPELAASLVNLAALYSRLGRAADARTQGLESVGIYQLISSTYPDRFLPELAASLSNLGALLADLGHPADAIPPAEMAVAVYRQLAEINPGRYGGELANSLANLSTLLSELNRPGEALTRCQDAVDLLHDTPEETPGSRSGLASALSNLGMCMAGLGLLADALPPTQKAVVIYRDMASENPGRYRRELATSLANLGIRLADLRRPAEALPVTKEAVALYRDLAKTYPDRYRPEFAAALSDLGLRYAELGRDTEALPVSEGAVRISRELAEADPGRYHPRLAASLAHLGTILASLRRMSAAAVAAEEALAIYQQLDQVGPARYQPERAAASIHLSRYLAMLGRPVDALRLAQEAVSMCRDIAQANPGRYRRYLAAGLDNFAAALASLGQTAEAETAMAEADAFREGR